MILIIDFGSQFNQLIARRVREWHVYCQIESPRISINDVRSMKPEGIILSGGPSSIYEKNSPRIDTGIFNLKIPVLGICYGMQFMVDALGGVVKSARKREYGFAELAIKKQTGLFKNIDSRTQTWMSHGDSIQKLPKGFVATATTSNTPIAAVQNYRKRLYGFQFHPEVEHTPKGKLVIQSFLFDICGCRRSWTMKSFAKSSITEIREQIGNQKVILGLSGGVDSSVTALLIHKAVGKNLTCIFVDNGLLRKNEATQLKQRLKQHLNINIKFVGAKSKFLNALARVSDPEKKRKIIGRVFMEVFEAQAKKIKGAEFLAQGTLYPDVIESISPIGGPSATIKSHHNVGGLPDDLQFELVEPLRELFKDEVREVGRELGLPSYVVDRQPFPGPGLAVRIIGDITPERIEVLQQADLRVREEIMKMPNHLDVWQYFAVLLPIQTVGVMGDDRTYENVVAVRAVESRDGMTADWYKLPYDVMDSISSRIINEVRGVNRVCYDISSKPPATIEWE